jgi:hypothetical protein
MTEEVKFGEVIKTKDRLPQTETPVLILVRGKWRVGELRWETSGFEDFWKAFRYWDAPEDDGQEWEWYDVTYWTPLPDTPEEYYYSPEGSIKGTVEFLNTFMIKGEEGDK